ncbi:hypothetical protein Vi05172_g13097 [Venturia inaequalis]|nr:hypothetical protein Vi05172_g13097 [Venturia inaequalis]
MAAHYLSDLAGNFTGIAQNIEDLAGLKDGKLSHL